MKVLVAMNCFVSMFMAFMYGFLLLLSHSISLLLLVCLIESSVLQSDHVDGVSTCNSALDPRSSPGSWRFPVPLYYCFLSLSLQYFQNKRSKKYYIVYHKNGQI